MESVADWLDRIVWDGKGLDQDIADREFRAGAKDSPVFVLAQPDSNEWRRPFARCNKLEWQISGKALPTRKRDRHAHV